MSPEVDLDSRNVDAYVSTRINDNHAFTGSNACLKLLAPGETPVYPDYRIPQAEADAIADKMAMQELAAYFFSFTERGRKYGWASQ